MAKKGEQRQIRQNGKDLDVIHTSVVDDYPLPTAEELSKLKEIDPKIVSFIMERATIEQQARLDYNNRSLAYAGEEMRHHHRSDYLKVVLAFILCIAFLIGSFYLIILGHTLAGSVFGGTCLIAIVGMFLGKSKVVAHSDHT